MNESKVNAWQSRLRCVLCSVAAVSPLPLIYVIDLAIRNPALRSSGLFNCCMGLLLVSIPIIFLVALALFVRRFYLFYSTESSIEPRHVLSAGFVAAFHGIYIIGCFSGPQPYDFGGM